MTRRKLTDQRAPKHAECNTMLQRLLQQMVNSLVFSKCPLFSSGFIRRLPGQQKDKVIPLNLFSLNPVVLCRITTQSTIYCLLQYLVICRDADSTRLEKIYRYFSFGISSPTCATPFTATASSCKSLFPWPIIDTLSQQHITIQVSINLTAQYWGMEAEGQE